MWAELSAARSTANRTPGCLQSSVRVRWGWPPACGLTLMGQEKEAPPRPRHRLCPLQAEPDSCLGSQRAHFPCHDFSPSLELVGGPDFVLISLKASPPIKELPPSPPKSFHFSLISLCISLSSRFLPLSLGKRASHVPPSETPQKMLCILET